MGGYFQRFRSFIFQKYKAPTILVFSFIFLILVGSILLSMPFSNAREPLSYLDNLFTATTSTCVTGLVTTSVGDQYNFFGHVVILILIQLGGLGLMTFISILLVFLHNNLQFKEKALLKNALNKMDYDNIKKYILDILKYTMVFEMLGALILSGQFIEKYGFIDGVWKGIFISVSAFCNAGIDIFNGTSSLIPYNNNFIVILTISALIIAGGLGFAVWFDMKYKLVTFVKFKLKYSFYKHKFRFNTKIALLMTVILISVGTLFIYLIEYDGALNNMPLDQKFINAFFNSVTLRTAGFATIDYSLIHRVTKVLMIVLMFIGGSPGGTAGGIKTTTFFLIIYAFICEIKQKKYMNIFGKHIKKANFISAFSIFMIYILVIVVSLMMMMFVENFESLDLLFEIVSAIGTVGLTTGITSSLTAFSKLIVILLMFIGRVGPITIAYALRNNAKSDNNIKYPTADVIVG